MKKLEIYSVSKHILIYKYINNIIIFFTFLILINCQFAKASYAANQSIRVSPIINEMQLAPGKTTTINLVVENLSEAPLGIHAEISGLDVTNQNISVDQKPSALTQWTNIVSPDIILDPLSKEYITVTITPPKGAKQSGYYETVFLTPIVSEKKDPTRQVVLTRIGAVVLATIGKPDYNDLAKKVTVKDFKPEKYVFEKSPATISFVVENKYFTHFTAKPFLTIKPLFGQEQTTLLEERHILPGTDKTWKFEAKTGNNVFYKAKLAVSIGGGNQILVETWWIVLPYRRILLSIFILSLLYFIIFRRNQIKKAILVLAGKK